MRNSPNSSRSSAATIEVRVKSSRLLRLTQLGVHLAAGAPALALPIPTYAAVSWLAAVAVSLGVLLRRAPIRTARVLADGRWQLHDGRRVWEGTLAGWYAHPWLCVAVIRSDAGRRVLIAPWWLVAREQHRRLRVVLRAAGTPDPGG